MAKLSYKILKLWKRFKRCRGCGRVMPRGRHSFCPLCIFLPKGELRFRTDFLAWYEREGEKLESVLPNPMPRDAEISRLFREMKKAKKND